MVGESLQKKKKILCPEEKVWMTILWLSSTITYIHTLLRSIGILKPTIGMITYRNTCALDCKGKIAYKLI